MASAVRRDTQLLTLLAEPGVFKSLMCPIHDITQSSREMTKRGFREVTAPIKGKEGLTPRSV